MKSIFIIGPSGSGKSTLSQYLAEIYKSLFSQQSVILINLDPANPSNEQSKYHIDMNNLITIQDIMQQFQVGPNGAMQYAMNFLFQNKKWLQTQITQKITNYQPHYKHLKQLTKTTNSIKSQQYQTLCPLILIFDLPGQIQLYLQNQSTKSLIKFIKQQISPNTCLLQLFDSTYIYQVNDFVSLCMISLVTMINLQLPHINVLNKIDVIKGERPALGILNQYLDITSIRAIVDDLTFCEQQNKQSLAVVNSISDVLDQYNLVSFIPCSVYKIQLIKYLVLQIQKTFNTHEIYKHTNKKYQDFIKSVDREFAKEQIISELENELFEEQAEDEQKQKQQIEKVLAEIKKEIDHLNKTKK